MWTHIYKFFFIRWCAHVIHHQYDLHCEINITCKDLYGEFFFLRNTYFQFQFNTYIINYVLLFKTDKLIEKFNIKSIKFICKNFFICWCAKVICQAKTCLYIWMNASFYRMHRIFSTENNPAFSRPTANVHDRRLTWAKILKFNLRNLSHVIWLISDVSHM